MSKAKGQRVLWLSSAHPMTVDGYRITKGQYGVVFQTILDGRKEGIDYELAPPLKAKRSE